jgi:hypothetical protein
MPRKWGTIGWSVLHDNAPAHKSVSGKDFLAKNHVVTLEFPPYSADLASLDFYQIPQLKSALKGLRYCAANYIIKNASEELKMASRNVPTTFTVAVKNL